MSEDDVRMIMKLPWVAIGSDGAALRPDGVLGDGLPHPRSFGTNPRVLGTYVREENGNHTGAKPGKAILGPGFRE